MKHDIILYHTQHTTQAITNTGIQRVVRGLADSLLKEGKTVIPVRFNNGRFELLDQHEFEILSMYNGPDIKDWGDISSLQDLISKATLLFIPELFSPASVLQQMLVHARNKRLKTATVFYDAIPVLMPEWYKEGAVAHKEYMRALSFCDDVFAISETSANDFKLIALDIYGNSNAKVHTLFLPNVFFDFPKLPEKENQTKNIEIISVSTVEVRKNHTNLLKAFNRASDRLSKEGYNLSLNIVGVETPWWQATRAVESLMSGRTNITWHKKADDELLMELYGSADFSVYQSIYEGYGLPVSESLYLNTPVICSNNSSVAEVASFGGCITFDPYNVADIEEKIIMMATNPDLRKEKVLEGSKIKRKSWKKYTLEILDILEGGSNV